MAILRSVDRPPRPPPRFLRFSLRGLLVLVAVCSVWLGIVFHRVREQARLVSIVKASGGRVFYDFHEVDSKLFVDLQSQTPAWLLDSLGVDFFHDVIHVEVYKADDELLGQLCDLPEIHGLYLYRSAVTNKGIAKLKRLKRLQELDIDSPNVDDEALNDVATLTELWYLHVMDAPISDRGLDHLRALTNLKYVVFTNSEVTPAGAAKLRKALPNCDIHL